ncbi:hypothetical protein GGX14DRAFT_698092 [Mycena pura]|uniref:EamA domain-containing protein n=1 Tax=Mycena pura TaxID=153505 RepID=A0AAD6YFZ0_9AGAR|nr:hypothetical protein GGX14DRAFT_698092 [Mycena pura]
MPAESTLRRPYVARTPNHADFALQPLDRTSGSTLTPPDFSLPAPEADSELEPRSRWRAALDGVREFLSLNAGLFLVTASQAVFSLVNVAVKQLQSVDDPVSTLEVCVARLLHSETETDERPSVDKPHVLFRLIQKVPHPFSGPEGVRMLLVFRGITGCAGCSVSSSIELDILQVHQSQRDVLFVAIPLAVRCDSACFFAGRVFLKETFARREALAGCESPPSLRRATQFSEDGQFLFGSPDGSSPVDEQHRMLAIGVAVFGVLGATGAVTSIRAVGTRAHPMHLLAFYSLQSVVGASILMVILRQPVVVPTRLAWLGLLGVIGVLGFLAQILLTMGFQRETAGRASMALYTQIIFASILERIFFHTTPTFLSFLGTSIIVSSAVYVALTKKKDVNPSKPDHGNAVAAPPADDVSRSLEEGLRVQYSKIGAGTRCLPSAADDDESGSATKLSPSAGSEESEDPWADSDVNSPLLNRSRS